jgi:hypothetical protein
MFPTPAFPSAPVMPSPPAAPTSIDFGAYVPPPTSLRRPSRAKYYILFILFMLGGGGGTYMYITRPGKLQVAVKPADATLSVDGVLTTQGPPFLLEKQPGIYRLSVARDGYVTREQVVQILAGQAAHMDIELEPSVETGFDLTSQPSGGLVWLDGQPLAIDDRGKQATTNFHASRIAPGKHLIEIRGNPLYQNWQQEFVQEPGKTVRLHAELVSVVGTPAGKQPGSTKPGQAAAASAPSAAPAAPTAAPARPSSPPVAAGPGAGRARDKAVESGGDKRGARRGSGGKAGDADVFESMAATDKKPKPQKGAGGDDDIFETAGRSGAGAADSGGTCVATISSKPWAEVSIDGKPTGKITPLVNYSMPCGKHRLTFKNADLMIERNESITLRSGQPFKKIFSLVENEL